jgi:signal transduction histidine kinase
MKSLADVFAILSAYLTEPLLLLATDGTVLSANPAAGEWFPRAVSELPGQPLRDLVASPPGEVDRQLAAWASTTTPLPGALEIPGAGGPHRVRCHAARIVAPNGASAVLVRLARRADVDRFAMLTDQIERLNGEIAQRKRAEAEREAVVAELSRTVRLAEMLMAVLGHDLRNPLGAVLAAAELAGRRTVDPGVLGYVERIQRSATRMSRLIDQLLDLTRFRLGHGASVVREPADLFEIVEHVVAEVKAVHPGRTITVQLSGGTARGEWDRDRLAQVAANLIANACQHSSPNTAVEVLVDASSPTAIALTVANHGEPIPDDRVIKLFEPFSRGEHSQGLGLGLYIVREIARAHGGDIAFSSTPEATRFTVVLPRDGAAQPVRDPSDGAAAAWLGGTASSR